MKEFNFDEMSSLAHLNPQCFFEARAMAIKSALMANCDSSPKLCALQDQIDVIRANTVTPKASLLAIAGLMEQNLAELTEAIANAEVIIGPIVNGKSPGCRNYR